MHISSCKALGFWLLLTTLLLVGGCTHQRITWDRTTSAAHDAAVHPSVWAPVLGAGLFSLSDFDRDVTQSLADHNPLFGSQENANDMSDSLSVLLVATAATTAMLVPIPTDENASRQRGDHLAMVIGGITLTGGITEGLKTVVKRERPNGKNDNSFPSGHASQAFAAATMTSANLHLAWGDNSSTAWADAGLYTLAGLTAWARVEADKHNPSDVMAGAAIGNFIGHFMDELLLSDESALNLGVYADGHSLLVGVQYPF